MHVLMTFRYVAMHYWHSHLNFLYSGIRWVVSGWIASSWLCLNPARLSLSCLFILVIITCSQLTRFLLAIGVCTWPWSGAWLWSVDGCTHWPNYQHVLFSSTPALICLFVWCSLTLYEACSLVQALNHSWLDYCSVLFAGIDGLIAVS